MAFSYYASITIDVDQVSGTTDFTDFPLLVSGTYDGTGGEPDLVNNTENASGYDIYFYSDESLTTKLDHYILYFNQATGQYIARVRIPTLEAESADTVIYMAYGDSGISADPSTSSTFNSAWKHWWPAYESSGTTLTDITGNSNMTKKAEAEPAASATGKIYRSQDYDNSDDRATTTDLSNVDLSSGSISYWAYVLDNETLENYAFSFTYDGAAVSRIHINHNYRTDINRRMLQGALYVDGSAKWFINTGEQGLDAYNDSWAYFTIIHNGTIPTLYINGADTGATPTGSNQNYWIADILDASTPPDNIALGNVNASGSWGGGFDNRIADTAISSYTDINLFKTIYNNDNAPDGTFYAMGSETAIAPAAGGAAPTGHMTTNTKFWGT